MSTHSYVPEEHAMLSERAVSLAERQLEQIQARLGLALGALAAETARLDSQTEPFRAADRLFRIRERKRAQRGAAASQASLPDDPGLCVLRARGGGSGR
jgi:hypothetical protein